MAIVSEKTKRTRCNLKSTETVVLYPTIATLIDERRGWRVRFAGTVYQPQRISLQKRVLVELLKRVMRTSANEFETPLFADRVRHFIVNTPSGRRMMVKIGDREIPLKKKTKRNGHFSGTVRLSHSDVDCSTNGSDSVLRFSLLNNIEEVVSEGSCHLIGPTGVSVISDIDDTLKHTMVTDRQEMLANTFLRPFSAIPGMPELYRRWQEQGCEFHYVSSSPWQLFRAIQDFCEASDFPQGSFHLRSFRLRDQMLNRLMLIRRKGKGAVIRAILRMFPHRQFILVGDSGERDPEIYARIARKFPDQVRHVIIRNVTFRPMTETRCSRIFERVESQVTTFTDPAELNQVQLPQVFPLVADD